MATPTPSTNTPQKTLVAFSSPAPGSVPGSMPGKFNFDSPAALGLSLEGSIGMGISMSALGLTGSQMGKADEDERRRRLEQVIAILKTRPARVSEEGIIGLCKHEGLEVVREPMGKDASTLMLLIGNEGMCEIPFRNGEIESVKLDVASDRPDINFAPTGSKILFNDLRPQPGIAKINHTLERFQHNLDKLLRMDKLSSPDHGGVNCYQAIFGVYTSLKKLFEHEKKMALTLIDPDVPHAEVKAEREVLCKKSGRPRINAGSSIGLAMEYWMDKRYLIPEPKGKGKAAASTKAKEKLDTDDSASSYPEVADPESNKIYSLTLECEAYSSTMHKPIRISDAWISDAIEKAPDASDSDMTNIILNQPTLDWLEPPTTYLPASAPEGDGADAMNLDNQGRLPNIRFIAKFNPPLVVPLQIAVQINESLGLQPYNDIRPTTFVGLALRPGEADPGMTGHAGVSTQELRSEQKVLNMTVDGKEVHKLHTSTLYIPKPDFARSIESIPFSHPKQLVELLPILRQYACLNSLMQGTFLQPKSNPLDLKGLRDPLSPPMTPKASSEDSTKNKDLERLQFDFTLQYTSTANHLSPYLTLHTAHPLSEPSIHPASAFLSPTLTSMNTNILDAIMGATHSRPPVNVKVDVMANADMVVSDQNLVGVPDEHNSQEEEDEHMGERAKLQERIQRAAKALDVSGDLAIWGGWVRREAEKNAAASG